MGETIIKLNPKGQLTIPNIVRKIFLKGNKFVSLTITPHGIMLTPVEVKEKEMSYTAEEWRKIKQLSSQKGKVYKSAKAAKAHIKSL